MKYPLTIMMMLQCIQYRYEVCCVIIKSAVGTVDDKFQHEMCCSLTLLSFYNTLYIMNQQQ